ncbi:hypothetical protein PAXRUDRAFT_826021 [Paxillus rubicundulus Ve08.2h10]|uniref:WHIM1 domain-containing protein n=1 Tax=Paxillus rubicundulus Ve08.2h10 TaxID=930991 RepID=A0A0D0DZZ9_9AGAM|nr:hypothetical protein PAXRUDRAFT_826021 [Paxillus rubicundulus Ve08.2h10]
MAAAQQAEKKRHICPPSDANHPSDRWESLFVYSFICKFTNLRTKVEGLETPMDFENALMMPGPDHTLSRILQQFILNLRPQTRNLSVDHISPTLSSVLAETFKGSERTVFWDDERKANVDPFASLEGGFFDANWDLKLKVLRLLVELQLAHSIETKSTIDRAWGVMQNKHKKKDSVNAPPDASDAKSQEKLQLVPLGQDLSRKRYWVADDSPRMYVSTNPWKITATFHTVSSTRQEYLAVIENLKATAPKGDKKNKIEQAHLLLIEALDSRIGVIDAELARVQRIRRKIEQKQILMAQAEIRETRTRRQTRRPDYVYNDVESGEEDADEYRFEEENENDDDDAFDQEDFLNLHSETRARRRASGVPPQRRSTRATRGKRASPDLSAHEWKGERRSTRLGASDDTQLDRPSKRARTEESTTSSGSVGWPSLAPVLSNGDSMPKTNRAAAIKPNEIVVEQVKGKKKSKFWFYAVEPIPTPASVGAASVSGSTISAIANGHEHRGDNEPSGTINGGTFSTHRSTGGMDIDRRMEGSLSPLPEGVTDLTGF